MKKYFFLLLIFFCIKSFFFTNDSIAETTPSGPTFCTNAELSMVGGDCISTCKAIAASIEGGTPLATFLNLGSEGFCTGQAEELQYKIYSINLKQEDGDLNCQIYNNPNGWDISLNTGIGSNAAPINFASTDSCPETATYDVLEIVFRDLYAFSGFTVFPDDSDKIIRTSNSYTAIGGSGSSETLANWMEYSCNGAQCSFADNSKNYFAPSQTWNTVYKKDNTTPLPASLYTTPTSEALHDASMEKEMRINGSPYNRSGYICESREFPGEPFQPATIDNTSRFNSDWCQSGGTLRVHYSSDSSELFDSRGTFPITVNRGDFVYVNFNFYGMKENWQSDPTKEMGVNFIFENVGGNLHLLGYRAAEDGMVVKISNAGRIGQ